MQRCRSMPSPPCWRDIGVRILVNFIFFCGIFRRGKRESVRNKNSMQVDELWQTKPCTRYKSKASTRGEGGGRGEKDHTKSPRAMSSCVPSWQVKVANFFKGEHKMVSDHDQPTSVAITIASSSSSRPPAAPMPSRTHPLFWHSAPASLVDTRSSTMAAGRTSPASMSFIARSPAKLCVLRWKNNMGEL